MEMVRAVEQEQERYKSSLLHFENVKMKHSSSRHLKRWNSGSSLRFEDPGIDDESVFKRTAAWTVRPTLPLDRLCLRTSILRNMEQPMKNYWKRQLREKIILNPCFTKKVQMKERFAKLLLGEDMSGGEKSVSSALALSNAITNLSASAFGEQRRLEPISQDRKERWRREMGWFLSVTDHIVEFSPTHQTNEDGSSMEVMTTKQRTDLVTNIPALKKLDMILIDCLDKFRDQDEFYYVTNDSLDSDNNNSTRNDDKWWLPTIKV